MVNEKFICCCIIFCYIFVLLQRSQSYSLPIPIPNGSNESDKYAVIFDAGSTGSRVHVFRFDHNFNLLTIGSEFELLMKVKPGLSSYASEPEAAARSLEPLLYKAEAAVPKELRSETPVKLGATAGLRMLKGDTSDKILGAVRDLIKNQSSFKYKPEWITILEGNDEAVFLWGAINYLLGKAGKGYSETVGTIDLGGGSVQMTYAVSKTAAENAPKLSPGGEQYIQQKTLLETTYNLYAHSYLDYGLLAARALILKVSKNSSNPCIVGGYDGTYTYNGAVYRASALPSGPSLKKCRAFVLKALKIDAPCIHKKCTFNGVWSGNGGAGQDILYVASFFYDIASEVGIVSPSASSAIVHPADYLTAAKLACKTNSTNVRSTFPLMDERDSPFICMALVYEYTLLVEGFGVSPFKNITLVRQVEYKKSLVEAAWPLGYALDAISSQE